MEFNIYQRFTKWISRAASRPGARWGRQASITSDSRQQDLHARGGKPGLAAPALLGMGLALAWLMAVAPLAYAKGGVVSTNAITVGPATLAGGPVPFDITGAIQSLTATNPNDPYSGGTIVVNGITVIIPANLVVTLPAAYKTVGQLFLDSPVAGSGLALNDPVPPIAAYEASIAGNIVYGEYRAGLVSIAPQSANTANGFIRSINYYTGVMCVGSTPGPCGASDARVMINDTDGRYGLANGMGSKASPDKRFGVDSDNPTIHAASGYPMCLPRVAPPAVDSECPMSNRLQVSPGVFGTTFVMDSNPLIPPSPFVGGAVTPCPTCNATKQAPLVVGDYIAYSGILARDNWGGIYVAAYSIEANVGIFTPIGKTPFYMYVDAPLITTGPAICPANAECQARLRTTIFMTDPSRTPAMYAVDENAAGDRTSRALPSTLVNTAVLGRFVFHTEKDTRVFGGANGVTREIMGRVAGVADNTPVFYGTTPNVPPAMVTANGLVYGQYVSPVGEYIFPEPNVGGAVLTPYNFRCLAFLAKGWGQGGALKYINPLSPFPEAAAPATVNCAF
ncbi:MULTISPECIES: hypothetical protein [unclassified Polaromonas]|uniref:hypothetical protein n=1 Tax=unclassified Polaromonas TaxID=2638319 RepID=UPI0018CB75AB|nr:MULTISPECIES: hypothetical protein [unclassified Polaromonas]MBG6073953.1 hypothetical protein [Polaromonas sp. CG_9.7]MBG6115946.1 hypothetical protein [Polaromonas sp. CG_9.2]MDH6183525.1 hypothetical protein [Polaromonas sp. CG_23.6]